MPVKRLEKIMQKAAEEKSVNKMVRTMVFLAASTWLGPDEKKLAAHLKYNPAEIRNFARRCRESGLWEKDKVKLNSDCYNDKYSSLALILDAMVVQGALKRVNSRKRGSQYVKK